MSFRLRVARKCHRHHGHQAIPGVHWKYKRGFSRHPLLSLVSLPTDNDYQPQTDNPKVGASQYWPADINLNLSVDMTGEASIALAINYISQHAATLLSRATNVSRPLLTMTTTASTAAAPWGLRPSKVHPSFSFKNLAPLTTFHLQLRRLPPVHRARASQQEQKSPLVSAFHSAPLSSQ